MASEEQFFFGEYTYSLDKQRRVAIPADWRTKGVESRFVMLPGRDSLLLLPYDAFKASFAKLSKVSFANRRAQLALAKIGSRAQQCVCDKQGRIKIGQRLLEPFDITDQVVMVGAFTSVQLWNPKTWEAQQDGDDSYLDELEKISENPDNLLEMLQESFLKNKE